jgi:hypothetical protein
MILTYSRLSKAGRLGNQLWQIASTLGVGIDHGYRVVFPSWDYQPFFSVPKSYFVPGGLPVMEVTSVVKGYPPEALPYLQDCFLIKPADRLIREIFKPSDVAQAHIEELRPDWWNDLPRPAVALHVRRGDNVTHPQGYHPLRSMDYYHRALEQLPAAKSIVVFSDDLTWCRETLKFDLPTYFFDGGVPRPREYADRAAYEVPGFTDWVDLFVMTELDLHVISNSTYAWWGAFLSENRSPIYPDNWFGRYLQMIDTSLMFPPDWVQVHDETQGGV